MTDKVLNLKEAREAKAKKEVDNKADEPSVYFETIAEMNKKKKEKLEKERLAANKGVLRSYRIKH